MNRSLLQKEWKQVRLDVLVVLAIMCAVWLSTSLGRGSLFLPYGGDDEEQLLPLLAVFAGLQLGFVQFGSESAWRTRDVLVFRASGPVAAFRAKWLVSALATTAFAIGPVLVLSAWLLATSPWAEHGYWGGAVDFALLGTLAWAAWGVAAFCCQLRHGWSARVVAALVAEAGLYAAAARASELLVDAPPWADWLFPLASAGVAIGFAWCAGRAFAAGADEDVPLRHGPGLTLAAGAVLAVGYALALAAPAASSFASQRLQASFRHVVETPEGFALATSEWGWRYHGDERDLVRTFDPPGKLVFDPDWIRWGWPEPSTSIEPVRRRQAFSLNGHWTYLTDRRSWLPADDGVRTDVLYESRSRRVHVFVRDPDAPRHFEVDPGLSENAFVIGSGHVLLSLHQTLFPGQVLDRDGKALTLIQVDGDRLTLEPLPLPNGDEFVGVERLVTRDWAEVGYRAPFTYENDLLIQGKRGLYRLEQGSLELYVAAPHDDSVAASAADGLVRLRSRYARYDALDPTIEVLDAKSGASLFTGRLAPQGLRTEGLKALACTVSLLHTPVASLASFAKRAPWREASMFDNPALLGGRRAWLLALGLAFAGWLAWRVRRETRAWGRSPKLGGFWVGVTLLLGAVGWVLFRIAEPRPARVERRVAPRKAGSTTRGELAAAGVPR